MSAAWSPGAVAAGLAASAFLFVVDLALSVMLLSVTSLSRVALRRLSAESGGRLQFLEDIKTLPSTHRAAVHTVRQLSLLGGSMVLGLTLRGAEWEHPWLVAFAVGAGLGVIALESGAARLLALRDPRAAARLTSHLVRPVHALTYPLLAPIHAALRRWAGTLAEEADERREADEGNDEEVEAFIEVGERDGILEADEGAMVRGIVDLDTTRVREVMRPRVDIVALPASTTVHEARRTMLQAGHSRMPVYQDSIDNVVGVLHVRDLLRAWQEGLDGAAVLEFLRPAVFVPESRTVAEVLREMRTRSHLALVVDEFGGLAGLVTLEDLLEEIVGEIRDEHERAGEAMREEPDGSWTVDGLVHVETFAERFALDLGERDFDSVGGLVVAELGRIPAAGETVAVQGLRVEILEADPRRVYRVRVRAIDVPRQGEGR